MRMVPKVVRATPPAADSAKPSDAAASPYLTELTLSMVRRDFPGWDVYALKAEFDTWLTTVRRGQPITRKPFTASSASATPAPDPRSRSADRCSPRIAATVQGFVFSYLFWRRSELSADQERTAGRAGNRRSVDQERIIGGTGTYQSADREHIIGGTGTFLSTKPLKIKEKLTVF